MGAHGWGCLGCFGLSGPLPDLLLWGWESTSYRLETEAEEKQLPHSKMATETCSSVCKDWHVPLQVVRHRSRQTESTLSVLHQPLKGQASCVWLLLPILTAHRGWLSLHTTDGSCCLSSLHTVDGFCCPFSLYITRY